MYTALIESFCRIFVSRRHLLDRETVFIGHLISLQTMMSAATTLTAPTVAAVNTAAISTAVISARVTWGFPCLMITERAQVTKEHDHHRIPAFIY